MASVGLSLPSFAEDGPGMGKAQGMVYDRASEIHLVSCCLCVFHCSTEEEQKEVKPPPRGWQMKLPEVRPQGNECSDDVTEGNLLTASLLLDGE